MAKIEIEPTLDVRITFSVSESEARALEALAGYGVDAFVEAFYEKMGKAYLKPHEAGLREFLGSILSVVRPALHFVDSARAEVNKATGGRKKS